MTEFKTIYGTYTYFNEIPIHSVFIWGDGLQFIKLSDAIPNVSTKTQKPNCFDLQKHIWFECQNTALKSSMS